MSEPIPIEWVRAYRHASQAIYDNLPADEELDYEVAEVRAGLAAVVAVLGGAGLLLTEERRREIEEAAAREAWLWAGRALHNGAVLAANRHPAVPAEYVKGWRDAARVLHDSAEEMATGVPDGS